MITTDAVVFDLDGVLVDSETVWDEARRALVHDAGGQWTEAATTDMIGMSSLEWSRYLHDRLGVALDPRDVSARVAERVIEAYAKRLPLLPGARSVVRTLAARYRIGLASSSNRSVIEVFLDASGLRDCFRATVSSEEVPRGKPAPDVYLEALRRLGVAPTLAVAVEDSSNGIRSASAAGMRVIAVPNVHFPPTPDALSLATRVVPTLADVPAMLSSQRPRK
jgi:HAD superfamily hydrolase (TIGR01509 family)